MDITQMINEHVVKLAIDYFDQCSAENRLGTLVGLYWHIDANDKTVPAVEEINEALKRSPTLFVNREGGTVTFEPRGMDRVVVAEDMKRAYGQYSKAFSIVSSRLRN